VKDAAAGWELFAAGVAAGGTGVWALAAAARVGVLRALLDLFPRASWDAVTWVLIPALLLAPIVVQAATVAAVAGRRPALWAGTAAAAAAGSFAALGLIGAALLLGLRHLPREDALWLNRTAPPALIAGFAGAVLAGWLIIGASAARVRRFRWAAVPAAAVVVALLWVRMHHMIIVLSYVLDRPEANGFFAAVGLGGGAGSAWAARRAGPAAAAAERRDADRSIVGVSHGD
jgi:hypothetical protein